MALYPNGRQMSRSPGRHFGPGPGLDVLPRGRTDRLNRGLGEAWARTASTPDGYGVQAYAPARTAGSMAALTAVAAVTGAGSLLQGGPMEGLASLSFTTEPGSLSLIAGLSGVATLSLSAGAAALRLVVGLAGAGGLALSGGGSLSMIVPMAGLGSWSLSGGADLKGRLSMAGAWTPYTALSPENLAAAVWGALGAAYAEPGTMGAKLNTASSGGVDLGALAAAVWEHATRTLTGTAGATPEQIADAVWAKPLP